MLFMNLEMSKHDQEKYKINNIKRINTTTRSILTIHC